MFKLTQSCIYGFAALMLTSSTFADTDNFPPVNAPANASYFFIQNAHKIHVSAGRVILSGLSNNMMWAEEQTSQHSTLNNRIGPISYNHYISVSWLGKQAPFKLNNPNGIITGYHNGKLITLTTTLTDAAYSPNFHTMMYTHNKPLVVQGSKPAGKSFNLTNGVIYIDSFGSGSN
jgi:hypothetical protein